MSIIRLSLLGDGLYAPDHRGIITAPDPFKTGRGRDGRGTGMIGAYQRAERPRRGDALFRYLERSIHIEAAKLTDNMPLVVMVHGFQFDPATGYFDPPHHHKADNPHVRVYHFTQHPEEIEIRHHSTGWPRGLGFAASDGGAAGLAIAFGWYSNPGFFSSLFAHGMNFYAKAYQLAETAAWHLACVLDVLTQLIPGRRIDIFCHSLGSRVVVRALALAAQPEKGLEAGDPLKEVVEATDRVLMLAGAEKVLEAQLMMSRLNRGRISGSFDRVPHFYNFISRENDVLDKLGENFGPAAPGSKQVIGHNGLERRDRSRLDVQLDDRETENWFFNLPGQYRVSGDNNTSVLAVLDHWIHFTWRENMRVYHDILRDRGAWDFGTLLADGTDSKILFDRVRRLRGPGSD